MSAAAWALFDEACKNIGEGQRMMFSRRDFIDPLMPSEVDDFVAKFSRPPGLIGWAYVEHCLELRGLRVILNVDPSSNNVTIQRGYKAPEWATSAGFRKLPKEGS